MPNAATHEDAEPSTGAAPVLSVVLPTFNECENIEPLVRRLVAALEGIEYEVLVMDDRSPDGTAAHARRLLTEIPRLRVFERQPPQGLTHSIREGVESARGRFVTWMDADLSQPPEIVRELLEPLQQGAADVTVASRYVPGGRDARASNFERMYSWVINRICRVAIHRGVRDYTSGFVMSRRELILAIGLSGDYGEYCIELLGRAALAGLRVQEVPYSITSRVAGESKTRPNLAVFFKRGLRYLYTVARVARLRFRGVDSFDVGA